MKVNGTRLSVIAADKTPTTDSDPQRPFLVSDSGPKVTSLDGRMETSSNVFDGRLETSSNILGGDIGVPGRIVTVEGSLIPPSAWCGTSKHFHRSFSLSDRAESPCR